MSLKIPAAGVNPALNDADNPTHIATLRLAFVGGVLHQLWAPIDWTANGYEWHPVESVEAPAPEPAPDPGP